MGDAQRAGPQSPEQQEELMMGTNDPTNWEHRLAGATDVPTHEGQPDYGFYRVRTRDKQSWRTVAYWYADDGTLRCHFDGRDIDETTSPRASEVWIFACEHPISHELYGAIRRGEPWPDLNEAVTRSNRAPADNSFEALQERIDDLVREAERLIKAGPAKTKDAADQAADVANKLAELRKTANKEREHEKAPHLQAEREVDDKWRPMIGAADIYASLKEAVCKPFLAAQKAKKDRAEAEARRVADEAAKAAREAEAEARRKAEEATRSGNAAAIREAEEAKANAAWHAEAADTMRHEAETVAATSITAGTRGRSVGLRGKTVVVIEDRATVLAYFNDRQEITDALQKMAEAAVRAKITVPGVRIDKDSQAA